MFNTEKSPNPKTDAEMTTPSKCAVLFPLQLIEADLIRYFKNTKESPDYNDFDSKYGHSHDVSFADLLWLCNSLVTHSGMKIRNCSLVFFTNNDSPHDNNSVEFGNARQKTKDLKNLYPDFQLIPMKLSDGRNFDGNLFYKEFISQLMDSGDVDIPEVSLNVDWLFKRLFQNDYRNRALQYLTVEILNRPQFSVGIYGFTTKKKGEPQSITLSRATKEIIKSKRSYKYGKYELDNVENDANISLNEKLSAEKTVKYIEIGGEKIKFTPLETYEMKQFMQPSIKILGFKPMEYFKQFIHKKSAYFVYPSEKRIKNSTQIFRALWESCLNANKIIICIVALRLKSYPRFAALIPQREDVNANRFDGFRMEFIPFTGEVRDHEEHIPKIGKVDDETVDTMRKAISKLTINYDSSLFKNPSVAKIYNKIEKIEFNEDDEQLEDLTLPKVQQQDERIKIHITALSELIDGFDEVVPKRKATEPKGGNAKKAATDINHEYILNLCRENNTKGITVAILRDYLRSKNISGSSSMKKDDLIAKVVELG